MSFDIIESNYNGADETINFGTRAVFIGDNLYETSTLASIKCTQENVQFKQFYCKSIEKNGQIYYSINETLKVTKDKEFSHFNFDGTFDDIIDVFYLASDSSLLIVCLRNRGVLILNVLNDYECIFNESLCNSDFDSNGNPYFINCFEEPTLNKNFLIVAHDGKIYRLSIDANCFIEELDNTSRVITIDEICDLNFPIQLAAFNGQELLLNGTKLVILNIHEDTDMDDEPLALRKVYGLGKTFLALEKTGNLLEICNATLLQRPLEYNLNIIDMVVISESDNIQILCVTQIENINNIQLFTYPNLNQIFSLKLNYDIILITPTCITADITYISKLTSDRGVKELRFHSVYETDPEIRLKRLLRNKKLIEAEQFAQLFNLDMMIIRKAKAQLIVDKLTCDTNDVNKLIELLDGIDDVEFKLKSCLDVECDCEMLDDIHRILQYGCNVNANQKNSLVLMDIEKYQKILQNLLYKFETFMILYENGNLSKSWLEFCETNLLDQLQMFLKNELLEDAMILYSRLDQNSKMALTKTFIQDILQILQNIPMHICQTFLKTFIPQTLTSLPSSLQIFVKWIQNYIFMLEKQDSIDFPDSALKFVDDIITMCKLSSGMIQQQYHACLDDLNTLSCLMKALKTIETLKTTYAIIIPLNECLHGPKNVVRILLNLDMDVEGYDNFLKDFLLNFLIQNNLNPDEVFYEEIVYLMNYEEQYWTCNISKIFELINSEEIRLETMKIILDIAKVPWSNPIRQLALSVLQCTHPLVNDIKKMIENEHIYIVLRKPKYGINEKNIYGIEDFKFFVKRIIYCNEPTMITDVFQLCKNDEEKQIVSLLLIQHFIQIGNYSKAIEVLKNNYTKTSINVITAFIETTTNNEFQDTIMRKDSFSFISHLIEIVNIHIVNPIEQKYNRDNLYEMLCVSQFNYNFNLDITTKHLKDNEKIIAVIDFVIDYQVTEWQEDRITMDTLLIKLRKLARFTMKNMYDIFLRLYTITKNYNLILYMAEHLYSSENLTENLCMIVIILMRCIGKSTVNVNQFDTTILAMPNEINDVDDDQFLIGLKLSMKIIQKAILNAEINQIQMCLDIANCINTTFYITRKSGDNQVMLFENQCDYIVPTFATFKSLEYIYNLFSNYVNYFRNSYSENSVYFQKFMDEFNEYTLKNEIELLRPVIDNLLRDGHLLTTYKILNNLHQSFWIYTDLQMDTLREFGAMIKSCCLLKLIEMNLTSTCINQNLFYNSLLILNKDISIQTVQRNIRFYKRDPKKFESIAEIGLRLYNYYKLNDSKEIFMDIIITSKWWKKLNAFNWLVYDHFYKSSAKDRLDELLQHREFTPDLILEYCRDYNLNVQKYYLIHLERCLINWKPQYKIVKRYDNFSTLHIENDAKELLEKCLNVIRLIDDKRNAYNLINNTWNMINFYYYEVYQCIIEILCEVEPVYDCVKHGCILKFLNLYQRCNKPSEAEIEKWYTQFPNTQSIDPLSEFRLPFTPLLFATDIWHIIRPEINLKTYKLWFDSMDLLKKSLDKDDICTYVIKEIVSSGVLKQTRDEWILYPKYENLFNEIDECVKHITNLERATSVVYHLMTHTPKGIDLVRASNLCYKYALKYKNEHPDSSEVVNAFRKVEYKYNTYFTIHTLHLYQLADEQYLNLASQPKNLITALYLDEKILRKSESIDLFCPDINKAVDSLCEHFELNVTELRLQLIKNLLNDSMIFGTDLDTTLFLMNGGESRVNSTCQNDEDLTEKNLKRIAYICMENITFWQSYLLQIGFDTIENEEQLNKSIKVKALKVLANIADPLIIYQLTELEYDEFICLINKCEIVSLLEYSKISMDIEQLDATNKKDLLKQLAQKILTVFSIKTMGTICTTYEIINLKYWEFIMNCAIKLNMIKELRNYLDFLKNENVNNQRFYIDSWQFIINRQFDQLNASYDNIIDKCVDAFIQLQNCPVLFSLNLLHIFKQLMQLNQIEFAAILLQYFPDVQKESLIKEVLQTKIDLTFDNIENKGVWGIRKIRNYIENVKSCY